MKRIACGAALVVLAAAYSDSQDRAAGVAARATEKAADQPALNVPASDISSCDPRQDVSPNLPQDSGSQQPFFDSYSWKAFAALVCDGTEGQHDTGGPRTGDGPRIFEAYKSAWEIFHPGKVSTDFDTRKDKEYNPCGPKATGNDLVIAETTKFVDAAGSQVDFDFDEVGINAEPFGPLPAQSHTYAHYLTQFNRESFRYLTDVLAHNTGDAIDFPVGSINVKSAWVEMKHPLDKSRFYTRRAWIRIAPNACKETTVGLVALHVVQKTARTGNWIWSTFEHVDNAPDDPGPACKPPLPRYTFHDRTCDEMPQPPRVPHNDPFASPRLFNVVRTSTLISEFSREANDKYHGALSSTIWRNYQLVMTQWPIGNPSGPVLGSDCNKNFPGCHPMTSFANTVIETFFQLTPNHQEFSMTCIACHGQTVESDFVWALQVERPETQKAALVKLKNRIRAAGIPIQ
jgi:hypothetical protein